MHRILLGAAATALSLALLSGCTPARPDESAKSSLAAIACKTFDVYARERMGDSWQVPLLCLPAEATFEDGEAATSLTPGPVSVSDALTLFTEARAVEAGSGEDSLTPVRYVTFALFPVALDQGDPVLAGDSGSIEVGPQQFRDEDGTFRAPTPAEYLRLAAGTVVAAEQDPVDSGMEDLVTAFARKYGDGSAVWTANGRTFHLTSEDGTLVCSWSEGLRMRGGPPLFADPAYLRGSCVEFRQAGSK